MPDSGMSGFGGEGIMVRDFASRRRAVKGLRHEVIRWSPKVPQASDLPEAESPVVPGFSLHHATSGSAFAKSAESRADQRRDNELFTAIAVRG